MSEKKRDFFVSYNKVDKQWAKWIAGTLESNGYSCYLQAWDFRPGDNFVLNMHDALINYERFIAVLSKDYLDSVYCQAEWASAFNKDPNSEKRLFIPVRITDIEPDGLLAPIIYIDLFEKNEEVAEKALLQGVDTKSIPRNRPSFPGAAKVRFPGSLPFNNLPYSRNNYFTGRDNLLENLSNKFESGKTLSSTQLIVGVAGVGKTQIALEYAYRFSAKYNWIWWIPAETDVTVLAAYRDFAEKMMLTDKQQNNSEIIVETVLNWLDTHSEWLFIYDNVDNISTDTYWWPKNIRGNILITTRNRREHMGESLNISVFSEDEANDFLATRTRIDNDHINASQLSKRLGCLPLALEQAAAYILENNDTFEGYYNLLDEYGLEVFEQNEHIIDYADSITTTWNISIDKIGTESARQFFNLCAYFAPDEIHIDFFTKNVDCLPEQLNGDVAHELKLNKIISTLTKYSLMNRNNGKLSIHRLLQEVVRKAHDGDLSWITYCLDMIENIFKFEYGNIDSHKQSFPEAPHVVSIAEHAAKLCIKDTEKLEKAAFLLHDVGLRYSCMGNYSEALSVLLRASEICEDVLGEEHSYVATMYNNIGRVYHFLGMYDKALEWYYKSLSIYKKINGINPLLAKVYNNIAGVYKIQGKYSESMELYLKAKVIYEKTVGKEDPDTAETYNNIAGLYKTGGEYPKALKWYYDALYIRNKVFGNDHPVTATSYNNVATVYDDMGEYVKAHEWHRKALDVRERILGTNHPDAAMTYNNIACVYNAQGEYTRALEWHMKALEIRENVLGIEHLDTAITYNNIAEVKKGQGSYMAALDWYVKSLKVFTGKLGRDHPNTKGVISNAEICYEKIGSNVSFGEWLTTRANEFTNLSD